MLRLPKQRMKPVRLLLALPVNLTRIKFRVWQLRQEFQHLTRRRRLQLQPLQRKILSSQPRRLRRKLSKRLKSRSPKQWIQQRMSNQLSRRQLKRLSRRLQLRNLNQLSLLRKSNQSRKSRLKRLRSRKQRRRLLLPQLLQQLRKRTHLTLYQSQHPRHQLHHQKMIRMSLLQSKKMTSRRRLIKWKLILSVMVIKIKIYLSQKQKHIAILKILFQLLEIKK